MNIGLIGFGNIAKAFASGMHLKSKKDVLYASDINYSKLKKEAENYHVTPLKTNQEVIDTSDLIILCIKPHQLKEAVKELDFKDKIIVSFVAGKHNEDLEEIIENTHHITMIPNTCMSVGEGIFITENEHTLTKEQFKKVEKTFKKIGIIELMDEDLLEIGTVIAGCSPAYVAMFMEALGDAACKHGLSRETGYRLIAKMVEGTGKMAFETKKHPAILKDEVCSPKGSTIKGVAELEEENFRGSIIEAIDEVMD